MRKGRQPRCLMSLSYLCSSLLSQKRRRSKRFGQKRSSRCQADPLKAMASSPSPPPTQESPPMEEQTQEPPSQYLNYPDKESALEACHADLNRRSAPSLQKKKTRATRSTKTSAKHVVTRRSSRLINKSTQDEEETKPTSDKVPWSSILLDRDEQSSLQEKRKAIENGLAGGGRLTKVPRPSPYTTVYNPYAKKGKGKGKPTIFQQLVVT